MFESVPLYQAVPLYRDVRVDHMKIQKIWEINCAPREIVLCHVHIGIISGRRKIQFLEQSPPDFDIKHILCSESKFQELPCIGTKFATKVLGKFPECTEPPSLPRESDDKIYLL